MASWNPIFKLALLVAAVNRLPAAVGQTCGTCTNCYYAPTNACFVGWTKEQCAQVSAYTWCGDTPPAPSPAPTTAKPAATSTTKPTTAKPTTAKPLTAKPLTAKPLTAKPTTAKPVTSPTQPAPTPPAPTSPVPTPSSVCGSCTNCLYVAGNTCTTGWTQQDCASVGWGTWCGGGGQTVPSPAPVVSPVPQPVAPTPLPPTSPTPTTGNGGGCKVGYWGQNSASYSGSKEGDLVTYCDGSWDIIVMAFLVGFDASGMPQDPNFSFHTDGVGYTKIAQDIVTCQSRGVKLLLSIGGSTGSVLNSVNAISANAAADNIWKMYLGGSGATRPLGSAILDGVDLDIENGDTGNKNWSTFVTRLRSYFPSMPSRKFYVAAAPQCPNPDAALGPSAGLAITASQIDLIFIQFYNNPGCALSGSYNMATWMSTVAGTSSANAKLFIGVPAAATAAGSGYVTDVNTLNSRISTDAAAYGSRFGGVMTWDAGLAGLNAAYWASVRSSLDTNHLTCSL